MPSTKNRIYHWGFDNTVCKSVVVHIALSSKVQHNSYGNPFITSLALECHWLNVYYWNNNENKFKVNFIGVTPLYNWILYLNVI